MRKHYLLSLLAALFMLCGTANAERQSPYKVDFNTEINTTPHDFRVALGWRHFESSYYAGTSGNFYPEYTYLATGGVDDTGCLKVGTQTAVGTSDDYGKTIDLLITPYVSGNVSIAVKKNDKSGSIRFYTVTRKNGKYERGDEITVSLPELSTTDFTTVSLPKQDGSYIGIWCNNVSIDDFSAGAAEVEIVKSMKLSGAKLTSPESPMTTADGTFPLSMDVTVTNTGEVDLNPGDENYSLSIYCKSMEEVVSTKPIDKVLKVGESATFSLSTNAKYASYSGRNRYDIKENLSGTNLYCGWVEPRAYAPKLVVRGTDGIIENEDSVNFGRSRTDTTMVFTVKNEGSVALKITSIDITDGFTSSLKAPVTVEPDEQKDLNLTMTSDVKGMKSGKLVIKSEGEEDFILKFAGTVIDPDKYYVDFEDGEIPVGTIYDGWKLKSWPETTNKYVLSNTSKTPTSKFILPLLEVSKDEKMTFDAGRGGFGANLKVYYSTDRVNWTLAREIESKDMPQDYVSLGSYNYKLGSFVLDNIPEGRYYIAFDAGYVNVDNIYGFTRVAVDHDVMAAKTSLPKQGMVNMEYKASVTLSNINIKPETGCTAELYFNDEAVAKAEPFDIGAGSSFDLNMSYVPHETGTYKAFIKFVSGDFELTTDTVDVAVGEETSSSDVQVGTANGYAYDAPLYLFYKQSETETIYTADQLGLKKGAKITGLTYYGYNSLYAAFNTDVTVWMENTSATEFAEPYAETPKANLTQMFDGTYTFTQEGSESSPVKMLQLSSSKPFVYTGGNLRVVVRSVSDYYASVSFQANTKDKTHSITRRSDSSLDGTSYSAAQQPVVTLSVALDPSEVSGTVSDTYGAAIKDADVTLTSGDVIYKGKTGADGKYAVTVIQKDKTYTATYAADGYAEEAKEGIAPAGSVITGLDIRLAADDPVFTAGQPALVCLPVSLTPDVATGEFYRLKSYDGSTVTAEKIDGQTEVGVPYLLIPAAEKPFSGLSGNTDVAAAGSVTVDNLTFSGSYSASELTAGESSYFYGISGADDKSAVLTGASSVKPFGAFFSSETQFNVMPKIVFTDKASGIVSVDGTGSSLDTTVYTLDGRKAGSTLNAGKLKSGIYIIGGKKVIIK